MTSRLHAFGRSMAGLAGALAVLAAATGTAWAGCDRDPVTGKPTEAVTLATTPATPATGDNDFTVTIRDATCAPIVGAAVTLELVMPAMPGMPEMRNRVRLAPAKDPRAASAGTYAGRGQIFMAGKWNATITAVVHGVTVAERTLTLTAK